MGHNPASIIATDMDRCHDSGYDEETSSNGLPTADDVTLPYKEVMVSPPSEKLELTCARRPSLSSTSSLSSSPSPTPTECRHDVGSYRLQTSGNRQIKDAKLLWHDTTHRHIWDLEFMEDGRLVIIAGSDARIEGRVVTVDRKSFHCLDLNGRSAELPFPGSYDEPSGISLCKRTGALAITDTSSGSASSVITILRHLNNNDRWIYKTHTTEQPAYRVALTNSDTAVCAVRWEKLVKYSAESAVWSRSISASNELVPYVSTTAATGHIIVSTPSTNRVSVFNSQGKLLVVLPTWSIRRPTGVCTDSSGRVLVADRTNQKIFQYTTQGNYVQTLVRTEEPPSSIDLYEDRYLAVGTYLDGLYLYELTWH